MQFNKALFLLLVTTGISRLVADEPTNELPLEVGKSYRITLASDDIKVGFINSNASTVKILRVFRYPWIEIEIAWTPGVTVNEKGESVEPSPLTTRTFFNLDHAAAIMPVTETAPANETAGNTDLRPSPTEVVKQFFSAVESADKEKVLSLIADYPDKEKKFASSSLGRYMEKPATSRKIYPRDVLDAKVLRDAAVVLVGERLSERDYDIDPVFLVRRSGEWKIAPGIYYPVLRGDAKNSGYELFELAKWAGAAMKEGYFASSKDDDIAERIVAGKPVSLWIELLRDSYVNPSDLLIMAQGRPEPIRAKAEAVPMLVSLLNHSDDSVRFGAAAVLGEFGEHARPAVPMLRAALEDKSTLVRVGAANALWRIAMAGDFAAHRRAVSATRSAMPVLVDSLKSKDPKTRRTAIDYLSRTSKYGVPYLVPALNSDDPHWRRAAARAIRQIWQEGEGPDASEVVPHLVTALQSDDEELRELAAAALSLMGPPAKDAVTVLKDLLETENRNLRWHAIRALGRIGPDASPAVPRLRELLSDDDRYIRWAAADALDIIAPGADAEQRRRATADRPTVENDKGDRLTLRALDPPPPATLEPGKVVTVEVSYNLQSAVRAHIYSWEFWREGKVVSAESFARTQRFDYGPNDSTKGMGDLRVEFGFHQAADVDQLRCKIAVGDNAPPSMELNFDLPATWKQPE